MLKHSSAATAMLNLTTWPLRPEGTAEPLTSWTRTLLAFDVEECEPRLHFLIEGLDRLTKTI